MKKIISLVCVIAMMFAFAVTVNAADNEITVEFVSQDETTAVYAVNLCTTYTLKGISMYLDLEDAAAKGAGITVNNVAASKSQYNASQKMIAVTYSPTDGSTMTGLATLATITFDMTNVTEAFTVTKKAESTRTKFTVSNLADDGSTGRVETEFVFAPNVEVAPLKEEFVPETVKGAAIDATATDIELEKDPATANKNTYFGTAVFNATLGAAVNYSEAGFIWVKDGVETANKFTVDASVIAGGGTFEYGVAMYAIPDGVTITAIPYYVTAE